VTVHGTVADVLLGLAAVVVLASSAGILVMRDAYQRLHYVTPVTVVAPVIVALAVLVQSGWTENSGETWLGLLFVVAGGPFLSHATIRAARIRETGDWRRGPGRGGRGQDGDGPQDRPPDRRQPDQAAGGRDG
jgi:multisubunit Na+/H+ antiporter MnhG subunit